MERYINAYDFAEVIENLDITVAGKPARWNDAKYTVLKELAEAPTADVAPRAEVAREIFEEIEKLVASRKLRRGLIGDLLESDIAELKNKYAEGEMRDRLIDMIQNAAGGCARHLAEVIAEHLLANGVIVPPVGIGQTVWFFSGVLEEVCEAKVVKIEINLYTNPMLWFEFEYSSELIGTHVIKGRIDEFLGKTVFLTKAEAEKALERSGK